MIKPWKKISEEQLLKTPWFDISKHTIERPDGSIFNDFYIRQHPPVVVIFGMTKENDVILIKEYKYGADSIVLGLPGGFAEKSDGDVKDSALREFKEETGYIPQEIDYLDTLLTDPTSSNGKLHIFFATNCKDSGKQKLDHNEQIEVVKVPLSTLKTMLKNKEIRNITAVAVIHHVLSIKEL